MKREPRPEALEFLREQGFEYLGGMEWSRRILGLSVRVHFDPGFSPRRPWSARVVGMNILSPHDSATPQLCLRRMVAELLGLAEEVATVARILSPLL